MREGAREVHACIGGEISNEFLFFTVSKRERKKVNRERKRERERLRETDKERGRWMLGELGERLAWRGGGC